MSNITQYNFPTTVRFGAGCRRELAGQLEARGASRPLIVTDRGIAELDFFGEIVELAGHSGGVVGSFTGIWGNPVRSQVVAGVEAYRDHGADSIVALGGGAAMDVAKCIALLASEGGELFDFEDGKPDARSVQGTLPPVIAVPTTAGTGSEVGRSSVVSDDESHRKVIIFDPAMLPPLCLLDPELTLGLPPHLTAATGVDAVTHLVEAFLARGEHPMCDGIALEGLRMAATSLEIAVHDGSNLEARGQMLVASMMGAVAFQKGLGVVHSCAHALSTVVDMHHGLANAVMLPHALALNIGVVPERFVRLGRAVGLDSSAPGDFLRWCDELRPRVGLPSNLVEAEVAAEHKGRLVDVAVGDVCHLNNPVSVSRADFEAIYDRALPT